MMQYGNPLGYMLAVAIMLASVFAGYKLSSLDAASGATEFSRNGANLAEMPLPIDPRTIVPADNADATATYAEALSMVQSNRRLYENFIQGGKDRDISNLTALPLLLEAAPRGGFKLLSQNPKDAYSYDADKPTIDDLLLLGKCANYAGLLLKNTKPAQAKTYFEAQFALGARFYEERLNHSQLFAGLQLMAEATAALKGLPDASPALAEFDTARIAYGKKANTMWDVIGSIDLNKIALHNGDISVLARTSKERVWRIESILKLGRMKYEMGVERGDASSAGRLLQQLADTDPDPAIKAAAERANRLTVEEFRMIR